MNEKIAAGMELSTKLNKLQYDNELLSSECSRWKASLAGAREDKSVAEANITAMRRQVMELEGSMAEMKQSLLEATFKTNRLEEVIQSAQTARDQALAVAETAKAASQRHAAQCRELLLRAETIAETDKKSVSVENASLKRQLSEITHTHHTTLVRLSEVESTHASLLRKIVAWGNASPDEIILSSYSTDEQDTLKDQYINKLHKKNAYLRWSNITLKILRKQ
jgi:chromosome segregation ATPase